jgi:predicted enzyme related to lactoylglutathione lyase
MKITLDTIGVYVADMAATLSFYRALGIAIDSDQDAEAYVQVTLDNGITLGILSKAMARQADPTFVEPVGQCLDMQFKLDSPADVDSLYASVMAKGFKSHTAPWDSDWGQRFASITDPDGRNVAIFADLG